MMMSTLITIPAREVQAGDTLLSIAGLTSGIPLLITSVSKPICGLISAAYECSAGSGHRILIESQYVTVERPDQEEAH